MHLLIHYFSWAKKADKSLYAAQLNEIFVGWKLDENAINNVHVLRFSEGATPCPFFKSQKCALSFFKSQNCALPFFKSQNCTLPFFRSQKCTLPFFRNEK